MRIMTGAFLAAGALGLVVQSAAGGAALAQPAPVPLTLANAAGGVSVVAGGPGPSGQITSRGAVPGGTWGKAQRVAGTGSGQSAVLSVSCASPGNCGAGGYLVTRRGSQEAMVVSERNGVWGKAEVVPGTFKLNTGGQAWVSSVSCASPGYCSAGGAYSTPADLYANPQQAFVVSEKNGIWGKAEEIPGLGALNTGGVAEVSAVSCGAAGDCVAGGDYLSGSEAGNSTGRPFLVSQENGRWGTAENPAGLAGATGAVNTVSCGSKGSCVAGGSVLGRYHGRTLSVAFVAVRKKGRWVKALPIHGMSDLSSVSCANAGNCTAAGVSVAVSQHDGRWGKAENIPGLPKNDAIIESVSCAAPGDCVVAGSAGGGFVVSQHNGKWRKAEPVPGLAALSTGNFSYVLSVSCGTPGNCGAGGYYGTHGGFLSAFLVSEDNGVWGKAEQVPGLAALGKHGVGEINSVSCASAGNCSAGGFYSHAFVVSQATRPSARHSRH